MFICGDFNTDLLKYEEDVESAKFIDTMYITTHLLISQPEQSNNRRYSIILFKNDMTHHIICGQLMNDLNDPLSVYSI